MARNQAYPGGYLGQSPERRPAFGRMSGAWRIDDVRERRLSNTWGTPLAVEDVFSTWLYEGNGSLQSISNGIDLAGAGGLVWIKERTATTTPPGHCLFDTARQAGYRLNSTTNGGQDNWSAFGGVDLFSSNGFRVEDDTSGQYGVNGPSGGAYAGSARYVSWTFRRAAKFFDVVTYTGNGGDTYVIPHKLGSTPGCIIIKSATSATDWFVWHNSSGGQYLALNNDLGTPGSSSNNISNITSTSFTLKAVGGLTNVLGAQYVAYIFASDAGGFGDDGTESIIKCGSYSGNGSSGAGPTVTLGWEPQWLLVKRVDGVGSWRIVDTMRQFSVSKCAPIYANSNTIETTNTNNEIALRNKGFQITSSDVSINNVGSTYVYIAVRGGPMRAPSTAASVFSAGVYSGTVTNATPNNRMLPASDLWLNINRTTGVHYFVSRQTGWNYLRSESTASETGAVYDWTQNNQTTIAPVAGQNWWGASTSQADYHFCRAPGFFDVVTFTAGTVAKLVPHNLGVVPELIFVKKRVGPADSWYVYCNQLSSPAAQYINLIGATVVSSTTVWGNALPTQSAFPIGTTIANASTDQWIAFLFASLPGVSKIGTYIGSTTSPVPVDCGFTNGARLVMIKDMNSSANWFVLDGARGITTGANDPFTRLNSATAETTNADPLDYNSAGFTVNQVASFNGNTNRYLYLAIAA